MNTTALAEKPVICLTFDVEDWFQVENLKGVIPRFAWNRFNLRVEKSTHRILDLLDGFAFRPRATFFILGWVAKRLPGLVKEIQNRGHEVACHGCGHQLLGQLSPDRLEEDLTAGKRLLEDIIGQKVVGYRAPSFSICDRALEQIRNAGFLYDASYNSFGSNSRYGRLNFSGCEKKRGVIRVARDFFEVPVSNLTLKGRVFPLGGGGYFRLLPVGLFKAGVRAVLLREGAFVFYAHPWEFDPEQPRMKGLCPNYKFRHYIHLDQTEKKLASFIQGFSTYRFSTVFHVLNTGWIRQ